jgi:hypothetical protein
MGLALFIPLPLLGQELRYVPTKTIRRSDLFHIRTSLHSPPVTKGRGWNFFERQSKAKSRSPYNNHYQVINLQRAPASKLSA